MAGQILAERLGWPIERVSVIAGDTRHVPGGWITAGSRSAVHVGSATSVAASAARGMLLERAGDVLEAAPADLVLADGAVSVRGLPSRSVSVTDLLRDEPLEVVRSWKTETGTSWEPSCQTADVAVDPETGAVSVRRYVVVHDSGREINPRIIEGQLQGGIVHGIGYALLEEVRYDDEATLRTPTFLDYTLASAPEVAFVPDLVSQESLTGFNPEHVKGVGEAGTIPAPAAILSAIESALRTRYPALQLDELPVTPQRLWAAIARCR